MTSLVFALAAPLMLPLLLVGLHFALSRFASQPAPLFQRERAVTPGVRLLCGLLGLALCYLACAALFFLSLLREPSAPTLTLDPASDSPAERAGVRPGDRARSVDGRPVASYDQFVEALKKGGETVEVELEADGQVRRVRVTKDPSGRIGVRSRLTTVRAGEALVKALPLPAQVAAAYLSALADDAVRSQPVALQGPVGIARTRTATMDGVRYYAQRLSVGLPKVAMAYVVLLIIDLRARRRYQASLSAPPAATAR